MPRKKKCREARTSDRADNLQSHRDRFNGEEILGGEFDVTELCAGQSFVSEFLTGSLLKELAVFSKTATYVTAIKVRCI